MTGRGPSGQGLHHPQPLPGRGLPGGDQCSKPHGARYHVQPDQDTSPYEATGISGPGTDRAARIQQDLVGKAQSRMDWRQPDQMK